MLLRARSNQVPPSTSSYLLESPLVQDAPPSESSDAATPKVLHIGCDVCPRWYVVDQLLFDHWREEKFTCCMIGEHCGRKDKKTALVSCAGVPGMLTRMGRPCISRESRRHSALLVVGPMPHFLVQSAICVEASPVTAWLLGPLAPGYDAVCSGTAGLCCANRDCGSATALRGHHPKFESKSK